MTHGKEQGRYARMVAFWGLVLLFAYGCFRGGGLVNVLDGWLAAWNRPLIDPFPLLGTLKVTSVICLVLVALVGFAIHRILNRPRVATALAETELEMEKVTWPSWPDTWNGTVAVAVMVVILLLFLGVIDLILIWVMRTFWGGS